MDPINHRISAWDGLVIHVREWFGGGRLPSVLCLPGIVRTGADFEALAPAICAGRRIVAIESWKRGFRSRR